MNERPAVVLRISALHIITRRARLVAVFLNVVPVLSCGSNPIHDIRASQLRLSRGGHKVLEELNNTSAK